MALRRGMQAAQEAAASRGQTATDNRRFFMFEGGKTSLRFFGNFENNEDPVMALKHYIKRLPKEIAHHWCGKNADPELPCLFCHLKDRGDRGISFFDTALFFLKDYSSYHKLGQEMLVLKPGFRVLPGRQPPPNAYETTKYPTCVASATRQCQFCQAGNTPQPRGYKYWDLSPSHSEQLISNQQRLRNFCRSCLSIGADGEGTLYCAQYSCGNCGQAVEYYPEQGSPVAQCGYCHQALPPTELLACTACEQPFRCDLQDFIIDVQRTDNKNYTFVPRVPPSPPTDEELEEVQKYKPNWEEQVGPEPPELQAAALGVPCPPEMASNKYGAQPYGAQPPNGRQDGRMQSQSPNYQQIQRPAPVQRPVVAVPRPAAPPFKPAVAPKPQPKPFIPAKPPVVIKPRLPAPPSAVPPHGPVARAFKPLRPALAQPQMVEPAEYENGAEDVTYE